MPTDATDATFEHDVLDTSVERPVVIDLWAPWCGPCRTLGPIIERVVDETGGAVELVKVNIDENPQVAAAFQVQSIPAVFAIKDRAVVDAFIGALGESAVREFVGRLVTAPSEADRLVAAGDEASLRRALDLEPDHTGAVARPRGACSSSGASIARPWRCSRRSRVRARPAASRARARLGAPGAAPDLDSDGLDAAERPARAAVRADDAARQEFLDLLEAMDPEDPRRGAVPPGARLAALLRPWACRAPRRHSRPTVPLRLGDPRATTSRPGPS